MLTRLLSYMPTRRADKYEGAHRWNDNVPHEKRRDWTYAKRALGRYFEMPIHYVTH